MTLVSLFNFVTTPRKAFDFADEFHPRRFFNLTELCVFLNKDNQQSLSSILNPKAGVEFISKVLGESQCYIKSL